MQQRRSATALQRRREQLPWPADRPFRILSIDGGGIRGIFPARVLAQFEKQYLGGGSAATCFDMVAGTSTGGIIALGLASGMPASQLAELYLTRGHIIFPPARAGLIGSATSAWQSIRSWLKSRYDREPIRQLLTDVLGTKTLAEAQTRLCIPSFEGAFGDVYIYKTPHHPDFYLDGPKPMTTVAMATSAAPTYFQPLAEQGHLLIDGGIWANNPVMIAVVDAMTCYDMPRWNIEVLSLGCGDEPYEFRASRVRHGGKLPWYDLLFSVMRLQSQNALGQARLLLGAPNVVRLDPPPLDPPISLDDWSAARNRLPTLADTAASAAMEQVRRFFAGPAQAWKVEAGRDQGSKVP